MFISRHKIDAIFDDLTQIYRDSEFLVIFIQNFKNYFKEPIWTIKIKIWKKWAKKFQVKILFYDCFLLNDAKLNENLGAAEVEFVFLMKANKSSERIWRNYFKCMFGTFICVATMSCISVWFCWIMYGNFDSKYLSHTFIFV